MAPTRRSTFRWLISTPGQGRISLAVASAVALLFVVGCATEKPGPPPPHGSSGPGGSPEAPSSHWDTAKAHGAKVGSETLRLGAAATNRLGKLAQGTGRAVKKVSLNYEAADPDADCGAAPKDPVRIVQRHFEKFLRYPEDSRYRFGELSRGYMNDGLARGGEVIWYGYLLEVRVESKRWLARQPDREDFVVRIRDGEVIDVHEGKTPALLHRLGSVTAKRAEP